LVQARKQILSQNQQVSMLKANRSRHLPRHPKRRCPTVLLVRLISVFQIHRSQASSDGLQIPRSSACHGARPLIRVLKVLAVLISGCNELSQQAYYYPSMPGEFGRSSVAFGPHPMLSFRFSPGRSLQEGSHLRELAERRYMDSPVQPPL